MRNETCETCNNWFYGKSRKRCEEHNPVQMVAGITTEKAFKALYLADSMLLAESGLEVRSALKEAGRRVFSRCGRLITG